MSTPRVRAATFADFDEIHRLRSATGQTTAAPKTTYGARRHVLVFDAPDGRSLAAATLLLVEGRAARLTFLAVAPRFQHLELGKQLVRAAEAMARGLGVRTFRVDDAAQRPPRRRVA